MRLYQFMKAEHGVAALKRARLKISRIHELNDPFEFIGVELSDSKFRGALNKTRRAISRDHGLLCFSKSWRSPVLWAHYAGNHTGVCLGIDLAPRFCRAVNYVEERLPKPSILDEEFMKAILFSKFNHWSYEQEYRCYLRLDEDEAGLYYADFGPEMKLAEVIVGHRSKLKRTDIRKLLKPYGLGIKSFKVRPAYRKFEMTEQKNASLWA